MIKKENIKIISTQKDLDEYIDKTINSDSFYCSSRIVFKDVTFNFDHLNKGIISIKEKGLSLANSILCFENCEFHNIDFYDMYLAKALFENCIFENFLIKDCTLNNALGFSKCNFIRNIEHTNLVFFSPKILKNCSISLLFLDNCSFENNLTVTNCSIMTLKIYDDNVEKENKKVNATMIFNITSTINDIIVKDIKTYKAYNCFIANKCFKNIYLEKPNGIIEQYSILIFHVPRYKDCLVEGKYHRNFKHYSSIERNIVLPYNSILFSIYYDDLTNVIIIEYANSYKDWDYETFKSFIFGDLNTTNKFFKDLDLNLIMFDLLYKDEIHNKLDNAYDDDYDNEEFQEYIKYINKAEKWYINNYVKNYIKTICCYIDRIKELKNKIKELKGAGHFYGE